MEKGILISFDGGEACGKTSQIKRLVSYLKEKGIDVVTSKEPGGTPLGEAVRNILLHSNLEICPRAEALLFNASRVQNVLDVIKPALEQGKVVILDRFYDSTYAYEGYAGNLEVEELRPIIDFAICGAVPDLTFLLDIDFDEALRRKNADENLKNLDRFESKGKAYHEKVRSGFLQLAKDNSERFCVVDAKKPREEVFEEIKKEIEKRFDIKD